MTKQEMLASVEAQIRKDIPRLMELREGCVIEYFINGRAYNCKVVETFPSYFNVYFDGEIESIDFELSENTFQIIGHDIMLNDVLEWIKKRQFFIDDLCVDTDGYLSLLDMVNGKFKCLKINWNLSSPYFKDQLEDLIKFLYNLKKE